MKIIPVKITNKLASKPCFVDDEDHEKLSRFSWITDKKGYAVTAITVAPKKRKGLKMHRVILGLTESDDLVVDHIDFNKLNNQRSNLRACSVSDNNCYRTKRPGTSSRFKGVTFLPKYGTWLVQVWKDRKRVFKAIFKSEIQAAKKYDEYASVAHGAFAVLNFPELDK